MGLGLAFDAAGDLYAALQTTNAIEKFTPAGVGSFFANTGLSPEYLAFSSVPEPATLAARPANEQTLK